MCLGGSSVFPTTFCCSPAWVVWTVGGSCLFPGFMLPLFNTLTMVYTNSYSRRVLRMSRSLTPSGPRAHTNVTGVNVIDGPTKEKVNSRCCKGSVSCAFGLIASKISTNVRIVDAGISFFAAVSNNVSRVSQASGSLGLHFAGYNICRVLTAQGCHSLTGPSKPVVLRRTAVAYQITSPITDVRNPDSMTLNGICGFDIGFRSPSCPSPGLRVARSIFGSPRYAVVGGSKTKGCLVHFSRPNTCTVGPNLA